MNYYDITEDELEFREKADRDLGHVLGSKDETVRFLPDLSRKTIQKDARKDYSEMEKHALIEEDGQASNRSKVDVKGTHYESQSAAEIAMSIMPLKGL